MAFEFNLVGKWLDLTSQEFEILKNIYRLELSGRRASPKEINVVYTQENKRTIQKQNLHHILRELVEAGFVERRSQGEYRVSLSGIRKTLEGKKAAKETELASFQRLIEHTEEEFKKHLKPQDAPFLEYLTSERLYQHMAGNLNKAADFNIVSNFPSIAYPPNLAAKLGRSEYSSVLAERCLSSEKLQANFLTDLDIDYLFVQCFRLADGPEKAYRLAVNVVDNLENALSSKKLDVRYHPDPHGLDVAIPITDEPTEYYLFTRDEHKEIAGAIYIRNKENTRNALHAFNHLFKNAEKNPVKQLQEAREKLKQKYGILGK